MHPMTLFEILYQFVINRTWWEQIGIRKEVRNGRSFYPLLFHLKAQSIAR